MTYEEKVRLFNAKRYLMPLPPSGTKNWTARITSDSLTSMAGGARGGGMLAELYDENTLAR